MKANKALNTHECYAITNDVLSYRETSWVDTHATDSIYTVSVCMLEKRHACVKFCFSQFKL